MKHKAVKTADTTQTWEEFKAIRDAPEKARKEKMARLDERISKLIGQVRKAQEKYRKFGILKAPADFDKAFDVWAKKQDDLNTLIAKRHKLGDDCSGSEYCMCAACLESVFDRAMDRTLDAVYSDQ